MSKRRQQATLLQATGLMVGAALLMGAWLSGCDDCADNPVSATSRLGTVTGAITSYGDSVADKVVRIRTAYNVRPQVSFTSDADSSGRFEFHLPHGKYVLYVDEDHDITFGGEGLVYDRGTLHYSSATQETLRVGAEPVIIQAEVGAASISVQVPEGLEGEQLRLSLSAFSEGSVLGSASVSAFATDGRAQFVFDFLPQETFAARLTLLGQSFSLPLDTDAQGPDSIEVGCEARAVATFVLAEPAIVSGSVTGSWQTIASDYRPRIVFFASDSTELGNVTCEPDGTYQAILFGEHVFRVLVRIRGTARWLGGISFAGARTFSTHPGALLEGVSMIESGIVLRLYSPEGDSEFIRAEVELYDEHQQPVFESASVGSAGDRMMIPNLLSGSYVLHLHPRHGSQQSWCPQWVLRAESVEDALPIVVAGEGEITYLDAELMRGGTVHGKVLGVAGGAATNLKVVAAPVTLVGEEWSSPFQSKTTSRDGYFEITGLSSGEYLVGVDYGESTCWYPGTYSVAEADTVVIRDLGTVTGIDWQIPL